MLYYPPLDIDSDYDEDSEDLDSTKSDYLARLWVNLEDDEMDYSEDSELYIEDNSIGFSDCRKGIEGLVCNPGNSLSTPRRSSCRPRVITKAPGGDSTQGHPGELCY
ncbi:hypothetical protein AQUCO_08100032v1 [Aquilegia coerulea]|uniref:Uncharacterized protein n=1 Tax=Aquilegia coerulea TaxID=218851 RepID=A0A2G5C7N0_AQUCA|nr:hypothetical protein AQUCO_08100032v1 [Aquilegia coerulea]